MWLLMGRGEATRSKRRADNGALHLLKKTISEAHQARIQSFHTENFLAQYMLFLLLTERLLRGTPVAYHIAGCVFD